MSCELIKIYLIHGNQFHLPHACVIDIFYSVGCVIGDWFLFNKSPLWTVSLL